MEYGTVGTWASPPCSQNLPENEVFEAFGKMGATYALLWSPEGDNFKVVAHFTTAARRAAMKAKRGDDKTFAGISSSKVVGPDSMVGTVARTRMRDVVYDAANDHAFTRRELAAEFGVQTIRFVPAGDGVLEFGTPLAVKTSKKKDGPAKQKTGRGRRMALEQIKKASQTQARGFLTPIVSAAKSWLGEDSVIEIRQQMIQAHVKEINALQLDDDGVKAAFEMADANRDGSINLDELEGVMSAIGFVHLKADNIAKILKKADTNRDKKINFEEFKQRVHPVLRRNFAKLASYRGKQLGLLS